MRIAVNTIPLILLLTLSVFAQTQTTGRISGVVKDQDGAVIVGAVVTVVNRATGDERSAATDASGSFAFAFLTAGTYEVGIQARGFEPFKIESVTVNITESASVNATLSVAGVTATVSSVEPVVKTDSPTLGQ